MHSGYPTNPDTRLRNEANPFRFTDRWRGLDPSNLRQRVGFGRFSPAARTQDLGFARVAANASGLGSHCFHPVHDGLKRLGTGSL